MEVLPAPEFNAKPTLSKILGGLSTQARVVNALLLRETKTRYGNYKIGFLWAFLEPLLGVTVFVVIFANMRSDAPGGMPLVAFMLVGFTSFSLFKDSWNSMQGAIGSSRHLLTFPQVTTFDVMLARGLLQIMVSFFVMGFLLYMAYLFGFEIRCERPLGVLMVCVLLCALGLGMGFLFASLEPLIPSIKQFSNAVMGRPLFISSGLFFSAETLPPAVRDYLMYNPVLHMIELIRGEFFYEFETLYGSWSYAGTWSLSVLAVGLLAHQALRKRAIIRK